MADLSILCRYYTVFFSGQQLACDLLFAICFGTLRRLDATPAIYESTACGGRGSVYVLYGYYELLGSKMKTERTIPYLLVSISSPCLVTSQVHPFMLLN